MDTNIVDGLKKIVGGKNVCGTRGNNKKYLCDQTTPYLRPEASKECVIVFPENTFEVSELMKLANENKVNVIARGGVEQGSAEQQFQQFRVSLSRWKSSTRLLKSMKKILL